MRVPAFKKKKKPGRKEITSCRLCARWTVLWVKFKPNPPPSERPLCYCLPIIAANLRLNRALHSTEMNADELVCALVCTEITSLVNFKNGQWLCYWLLKKLTVYNREQSTTYRWALGQHIVARLKEDAHFHSLGWAQEAQQVVKRLFTPFPTHGDST